MGAPLEFEVASAMRGVIYGTLSEQMAFVELQIPPKAVLEMFDAKNVSTGMARMVPGGATLGLGGDDSRTHCALPLVAVILTIGPDLAINVLSNWLFDKLKRANLQQVRIAGVDIEVTNDGIMKAIAESIDAEPCPMMPADQGPDSHLVPRLSPPASEASESSSVSSKDVIICLRVPPDCHMEEFVEGSAIYQCSLCQSDVLVAPANQLLLTKGEHEIVCMECWTKAQEPEKPSQERDIKLEQLKICKQAGEQAFDDLYERAHHPSDAAAYFSNAKESFYSAIGLARELGLVQEVERLEKRLAHIKAVFRSQFG